MSESNDLGELVKTGISAFKAENESQQIAAFQRPRDESKVLEGALKELKLAPDFAKKAYYSIPYKDKQGNTVLVEGPSIKAAMALARRWGNSSNGGRSVENLDDRLMVQGVFTDYETNTRTLREVPVSKFRYDINTKSMVPLREDKLIMAIQAGMSKAIRNAIIQSLPVYLVDRYVQEAKSLTIKDGGKAVKPLDVHARLESMVASLVEKGASKPGVARYVGDLMKTKNEADLLATLTGTINAIDDGHINIGEFFGSYAPEKEVVKGPISLATVLPPSKK